MPSISDIPWLRPARTLPAIEAGAAAGERRASLETSFNESVARNTLAAQQQAQQAAQGAARIQAEQQRTQMEMEQAKMELDAKTKVQQEQAMKQSQQLQIENARKDAELGLRQAQLKQAGDVAQAHARDAALNFADHDAFSKEVQAGAPPEKAIWNHPRVLGSSGVMSAAVRAAMPKPPPMDTLSESEITPAVPAQEAMPEIPEVKNWFKPNDPAIPGIPARPAIPKKTSTRTRKVPAGKPIPTQKAIDHLKENPDLKDDFDSKYGDGEAEKYLK